MKAAANSKKAEAPQVENTTAALEGSELGEVKVHENVIASLVRRAALSVEGVSRLAGSTLVDNIAEIVGSRRMQSRAITIEMADNNRVSIEIKLILKADLNIPEVAAQVQKAVIERVEKVTGMTVTKVGVLVQDIDEVTPPEEEPDDENAEIDSIPMN